MASGLHGVAEQPRQHRATGVLGLGPLERPPHLAQHLGLAQDARAEAGGHLEEVSGHGVVEEHRPTALERVDRGPGHPGQELLEVGDPFVEAIHHGIELGPHAGRQHHHLGQVGPVPETRDHLAEVVLGNGDPFEHVQRDLVLLESNDDDRQRLAELLARADHPQRDTRPSVGPIPSPTRMPVGAAGCQTGLAAGAATRQRPVRARRGSAGLGRAQAHGVRQR